MAYTLSPLDTAGTSTEETLMAMLQKIGELRQQPLIPDHPLAQVGAALQGLSSGMQGKPNPAIEFAQKQRQQDLSMLTQSGAIAGTIGTLKARREDEKFRREKFEFDKITQGAQTARGLIDTAMKTGDTDGLAYGLLQLSTVTGVGPKTMDDARAIARDTTLLEQVGKNGYELAVYALNGIDDPRIPPQMKQLAEKNPAALRSAFKITDPAKAAADLAKAQEDARSTAFKTRIQSRGLELRRKPGLLPNEQLELDAIMGLRATPLRTEAMELARHYMSREPQLPLDMALTRARRALAEAGDTSVLRDIAKDIRAANPNMTQGEALLDATRRAATVKTRTQAEEDTATRIIDVFNNLEMYSERVRKAGLFPRIVNLPKMAWAQATGSNEDVEGLRRQAG